MVELICKLIEEIGNNSNEVQLLASGFKEANYNKGEDLKNINDEEEYIYFIKRGLVRMYYFNSKGAEITIAFFCENDFVVDPISFFSNETSNLHIHALEKLSCYRLKRSIYNEISADSRIIEKLGFNLLFNFNNLLLKKEFLVQSDFSTNSYTQLIEDNLNYEQRIPVKVLAGYLGIHPNSLSRIRKISRTQNK